MTLTNFPNGVSSFGVPLGASSKFVASAFGTTWFVNANSTPQSSAYAVMAAGSDSNDGRSPQSPFLTMAKAFAVVSSGDAINFTGKITEQLVTPVQIFDVWVNGCGNSPRDPDSTPDGGQYAAAEWKAPASGGTAAQATCRVIQQGWRFTNFLMRAIDANAGCFEIVRNAASSNDERDGSHTSIDSVRFAGAGIGVKFGATSYTENVFNVSVKNCIFNDMTTAIKITNGGAYREQIIGNVFDANTNHIVGGFVESNISNNSVGEVTTAAIVLTGGSYNMVNYNALAGTYAAGTLYAPGTSDNWNGNAASTGFTAAVPA
jgi:hypothetical protein